MSEKSLVSDPALVGAVKDVLGDLVTDAWFVAHSSGSAPRFSQDQDGDIHLDSEAIVIQFFNGMKLHVWNSEWGGIGRWDYKR
jgi:hypothetical protein